MYLQTKKLVRNLYSELWTHFISTFNDNQISYFFDRRLQQVDYRLLRTDTTFYASVKRFLTLMRHHY